MKCYTLDLIPNTHNVQAIVAQLGMEDAIMEERPLLHTVFAMAFAPDSDEVYIWPLNNCRL